MNVNLNKYDPIPINTQNGLTNRSLSDRFINSTETVETGNVICSTNDFVDKACHRECEKNIKGDSNNDGKLNLPDVIYSLKVLSTSNEQRSITSCLSILHNRLSKGDGYYYIDFDGKGGNEPVEVYCDMTTDGGGWTFIANISDSGNDIWSQLNNPENSGIWEDASFDNEITFTEDYKSRAYNEVKGNSLLIKEGNKNVLQTVIDCWSNMTFRDFISSLSWNAEGSDSQWNDESGAFLCQYIHFDYNDPLFHASSQSKNILAFKWGEKDGVQDLNKDRVMITTGDRLTGPCKLDAEGFGHVDCPAGLGGFSLYQSNEIFEDVNECRGDRPDQCGENSNENYQLFIR